MSYEISIAVRNVSKSFKIYKKPSDRLKQFFASNHKYYEEFWALRDISFDVYKGSIVGIIGQNGSGKSTLLQIIAGTMAPTTGSVQVNGRVSALLELGSGFNPDFTGRENIYMNAAILGMSKLEIEEKMNSIIEFADIGEFIDQQVKTYSSGMFVRLAFSVSTSLKPEVLIVDEALSVGDVAFQKKCFQRIKELITGGTTVLLVSHDMSTIRMLCDSVVYLDKGVIHSKGDPKVVVDEYMKRILAKDDHLASYNVTGDKPIVADTTWSEELWDQTPSQLRYQFALKEYKDKANGSLKAILEKCMMLDEEGRPITTLYSGGNYIIRCLVRFNQNLNYFNLGILLRDKYGQDIFGRSVNNLQLNIGTEFSAGDAIICDIKVQLSIKHGTYFVTIGLQDGEFSEIYFYGTDALTLEVQPSPNPVYGLVDLPCTFNIKHIAKRHAIVR